MLWLQQHFWPSFDFEARRAMVSGAGLVAKARYQVVVDHAGGLHKSVDDGRSDKFEAERCELL
jgi:hypothetical protein